MKQNC